MKTAQNPPASEPVHVLVVGNNPIEMGHILDKLNRVNGIRIITEIAFDVKSIVERLIRFNPSFILIDDNIGLTELRQTVLRLSANSKTKDIPITVLKNSNYCESLAASSILDYLLKQTLSPQALYHSIKNTLRFRRTQQLLTQPNHQLLSHS